MQLRPYQTRGVEHLRQKIREGKRKLICVAPTGAGKTVIAAHLLSAVSQKGRKGLFLAPSRELIYQCSDKLNRYGVHHGILMAGEAGIDYAGVQVASHGTIYSRAVKRGTVKLPPADLVIVDECHGSLSATWLELLNLYSGTTIIGLTATPTRGDGRGLGEFYDDLVIVATYEELIAEGSLVPARVWSPAKPDLHGVHKRAGDYVLTEVEERMNKGKLVGDIVEHWLRIAQGRKTVLFASGIAHSMHCRDRFLAAGIPAAHVDGSIPYEERDGILQGFRRDAFSIVCNCDVLTQGWDQPDVSCAVLARPTKSLRLYRQMVGRILRPFPGKTDAYVIDHSGASTEHGFPDDDIDWDINSEMNVQEIHEKKMDQPAMRLIVCPQCFAVRRGGSSCLNCGATPDSRQAKELESKKGTLAERKREKPAKPKPKNAQERTALWKELVGWAIGANRSVGSAAARYKKETGSWPGPSIPNLPHSTDWRLPAVDYYRKYLLKESHGQNKAS